MKRGTAQVLFRYTPGAVFKEKDLPWCMVTGLELESERRRYPSLMRALKEYLEPWMADPIVARMWPDPVQYPSSYVIGPVKKVKYEVFPLVFECRKCGRMHWYNSTQDMQKRNPTGACQQGCRGENLLRQYPYAYIHSNGDIQPLYAPKNEDGNYKGIQMVDTGKFQTSYWIGPNGRRLKQTGSGLGLRLTTSGEPMRGIHLRQPEQFFSRTLSVVDIDDEQISQRMEHPKFAEIQLGGYLEVPSFKSEEYPRLFEQRLESEPADAFLIELQKQRDLGLLSQEVFEQLRAAFLNNKRRQVGGNLSGVVSEVEQLIPDLTTRRRVFQDTSLNEYLYCRYDLEPEHRYTLDRLLEDAQQRGDYVETSSLNKAVKASRKVGLCDLTLHEKFPVLLAAIGYTRDKYEPGQAVLRPFPNLSESSQRLKIPIPISRTNNEAVMFSLDPCRVIAFMQVNGLGGTISKSVLTDARMARAWLYQYLPTMKPDELAQARLGEHDPTNAAILVFRLLHTVTHLLMHAGKKYVGLEMDSLSEYLFPSALSAAIYVSKHTQFSLGALVTTFRHDLGRWMTSMREGAATCLFDPVCRTRTGACHACTHLKFSCQHHNRGLHRGLLLGAVNFEGRGPLTGYWSPAVDAVLTGS